MTRGASAGYDIAFTVPQPTLIILMLKVHPTRANDLLTPDDFVIVPSIAWREYQDVFFNVCTRIVAPTGSIAVRTNFYIRDSGQPDAVMPSARQHPIEELPDDVLVFLLGSRYCETQKLADFAWRSFGGTKPGWERVQGDLRFRPRSRQLWIWLRSR